MNYISSIFKPSKPSLPAPVPPAPKSIKSAEPSQKKTTARKAQLIALKKTGSGGALEGANVGRKKILV